MTFVFPLLLGGLVLAGVPVLLHLIARHKPRTLIFPALRFLVQKQRSNTRKMQLRHFVLLALRMLLIAALCLALARPRLFHESLSLSRESPLAVVLLFDTSASMEYRTGDVSRLDEAKKRASELLDQLPDGCRILVLDSGDDAARASDEWAVTQEKARKRIHALKIRPANAPMSRALDRALALLDEFARRKDDEQAAKMPRLLCVFSDRTRACWDGGDLPRLTEAADRLPPTVDGVQQARTMTASLQKQVEQLAATGKSLGEAAFLDALAKWQDETRGLSPDALPPKDALLQAVLAVRRTGRDLSVRLEKETDADSVKEVRKTLADWLRAQAGARMLWLDVGVDQPIDLALAQLDLPRDGLGRSRTLFTDGEKIPVRAVIEAVGKDLQNTLVWQLGTHQHSQPFEVKSGQKLTLVHELDLTMLKLPAGPHSLEARFETSTDALPFNNQRFATFNVAEKQRVLVLADDPAKAKGWTWALEDVGFASEAKAPGAKIAWNDYQAVHLVGVAQPDDKLWQTLAEYVKQGGGLAVVPAGDDLRIDKYASPAAQALMPAVFTTKVSSKQAVGAAWNWQPSAIYQHPMMRPFQRWRDDGRTDFFLLPRGALHYWEAKPAPKQAEVLVAYDDEVGRPAIIERLFDPKLKMRGKVILFTTPLDERKPAWNNYDAKITSFQYALALQSGRYLCGDRESQPVNFTLGQDTPSLPAPRGTKHVRFTLVGPDLLENVTVGDKTQLDFKELLVPGNFVLQGSLPDKERGEPLFRFSLNVPSEESDLSRVPLTEIEPLFGKDAVRAVRQGSDMQEALQGQWSEPVELYPVLMVVLLLALALENLLANKFYRQQGEAAK